MRGRPIMGGGRPKHRKGFPVLEQLLVCPTCRCQLDDGDQELVCSRCRRTYPVVNGTPVFVDESDASHDELDHLAVDHEHENTSASDAHKAAQSAFFDRTELAEFEIERPVGSPALYAFFLKEKFRRSLEPLGGRVDGWTALTVCGGSGMDAEFLADAGAAVISSDLSLGAASRVQARAARHDIAVRPVVADVEHLPFDDRSVDLVYVHDGLHHLGDPLVGIAEMARVARRAVCINEPARAAATAIGVRLGLALDREEAGNPVARLELGPTSRALESAGLRIVRAERYAMYYRHVPGRITSWLSRGQVLRASVLGWRLANRVAGRFGNKLTVVAIR